MVSEIGFSFTDVNKNQKLGPGFKGVLHEICCW